MGYDKEHYELYGTKIWRNNKDQYHRLDGPAVECSDGSKSWYINGELHRLDGPAFEDANGDKAWWVNGKCHRLDGPAVEDVNGYKAWWINGKRHRLDGPAVEYANGDKSWYIHDEYLTEEEFNKHPLVLQHQLLKELDDGI